MSKRLYKEAFDRIFPGNIGVCDTCYGPIYRSINGTCLSCRQEPNDPIMVEELVRDNE